MRLKSYPEAERDLVQAHRELLAAAGEGHRDTQAAARRLVELYEAWGRPAAAAEWRKRQAATASPAAS